MEERRKERTKGKRKSAGEEGGREWEEEQQHEEGAMAVRQPLPKSPAFLLAVKCGQDETAIALVELGQDVNVRDPVGGAASAARGPEASPHKQKKERKKGKKKGRKKERKEKKENNNAAKTTVQWVNERLLHLLFLSFCPLNLSVLFFSLGAGRKNRAANSRFHWQ
jgi:hypothetical protein